jgi:hypothetical protein
MSNVHILPDENLGGVLREFVEVDRKAEIGEKIIVTNAYMNGSYYDNGDIFTVIERYDLSSSESPDCVGVYVKEIGDNYGIRDYEYKTLQPTDIAHLREENGTEQRDGKPSRFRLVDRKAKVGEKVLTVKYDEDDTGIKPGDVLTCNESDYDDGSITVLNGSGFFDISIGDKYYVLEPLDSAEPEPIEVDTRHASPQVVDMLANLAQRVAELERELSEIKKVTNTEMGARSVHTVRWLEVKDEIDTLHANQRKLAEETTNRLDRHSERIRELAEMIGERSDKVFNFPIKPFKFSDLNGKTLRIYSAQDVTDELTVTVTVGIDIHDGKMYVLEVKRK